MADNFDDAELWLPSQFLSDDDWLIEKEYMKTVANQKGPTKDVFGVPYDFPADLSSPVESASTETESDEDDYSFLAGLTHQMAHSTLHADDRSSLGYENHKEWPVSRSPQSTLSVNGFSNPKVCSASPHATWDLLYAAAGEVAKMKLDEEAASYGSHLSNGGLFVGPTRSNHFAPKRSTTHSPSDVALYHNLQALQFEQLRQQQLLKHQQQQQGAAWGVQSGSHLYHNQQSSRGRSLNGGNVAGRSFRPGLVLVSQARQQQKHSGSGMQSVFLGNQPAKRERTGTGVFIPHRAGTPAADTRKKSGSSVPLPARVVQALNLNLNDVSGSQHVHPRRPAYNDGGDLRLPSSNFLGGSHGDQSFRTQPPASSREVGLPQEWTY